MSAVMSKTQGTHDALAGIRIQVSQAIKAWRSIINLYEPHSHRCGTERSSMPKSPPCARKPIMVSEKCRWHWEDLKLLIPEFRRASADRLKVVEFNSYASCLSPYDVDCLSKASPLGKVPGSFAVRQTTLRDPETNARYTFDGLFTKKDIQQYECIGTYESADAFGPEWNGVSEYAMEVQAMDTYDFDGQSYALLTPKYKPIRVVDAQNASRSTFLRYINSDGDDSNLAFVQALGPSGPVVVAFAVVNIKAGSELFVDYGPKFKIEAPAARAAHSQRGRSRHRA